MAEKKRYAVKQTIYIWAESRNQAARMVRRLQLMPKGEHEYSDFAVVDMIERPDAFYEDTVNYAICIFDKDV